MTDTVKPKPTVQGFACMKCGAMLLHLPCRRCEPTAAIDVPKEKLETYKVAVAEFLTEDQKAIALECREKRVTPNARPSKPVSRPAKPVSKTPPKPKPERKPQGTASPTAARWNQNGLSRTRSRVAVPVPLSVSRPKCGACLGVLDDDGRCVVCHPVPARGSKPVEKTAELSVVPSSEPERAVSAIALPLDTQTVLRACYHLVRGLNEAGRVEVMTLLKLYFPG